MDVTRNKSQLKAGRLREKTLTQKGRFVFMLYANVVIKVYK